MAILNEAEIEILKKTHPKKKVLRMLFLISGTIISILGLLLFTFGTDFGFSVEGVNLSILIDILIIIIGLILASKYFIAPYYLRENSISIKNARNLREAPINEVRFTSCAFSRLIAGIILILIGIASYLTFGIDIGHEIEFGSAVVLGGPSFFYLTGLPMFIVGLSLVLYFILSLFRGKFSESENFYFFYEIRPGFPWLTEIPKKDIEAIRYQNDHLGSKLAWVVFFTPFIVLQLMTAIPLFFVEKAGPEYVLSWSFLLYTLLEIIVLIILVLFQQHYFEIATKDMLYEMWFSPIRFRNQKKVNGEFKEFFDAALSNSDQNLKESSRNKSHSKRSFNEDLSELNINQTHFLLFQLLFGCFLVIISIIMMTQMVLFGPFTWWIGLSYGIILLIRTINQDFSDYNRNVISYDLKQKRFILNQEFKYKFRYFVMKNVQSLEITKWYRKLDFFDIVAIVGLLIFLPIQQFQAWLFTDTLGLIFDNIFSTMIMLVILIFVFLFFCWPINVIYLKTPSITYRMNITLKKVKKSFIKRLKSNFMENFKMISGREMKRVFLIRFIGMLSIILGVAIYMIMYFIFFF